MRGSDATYSQHQVPRFNTYLGAARAAHGAGEPELARDYYEALLELASEQGTRAELTGDIQAIYHVWRFRCTN